ncbi:DUF6978 family protein [Paraburkholderia elongata]|uniref:Uncharacterized protein n=1 Tax=Paraburkholderia elongata TaxID=2675747 RepID=A0A972NT88_9BURK|nr:hypothetical protein [Paraburkholderia elongata]NPT58681.1 hypothetical protein [Paraburkholderia elongata]
MAKEDLTEDRIHELMRIAKQVTNPRARQKVEGRHLRTDYHVVSMDGKHEFAMFTRQSTKLPTSYSAGIRWIPSGAESVMLVRCNGSSHEHTNSIEGDKMSYVCHVHVATERYLSVNKRDEGFAEHTAAYTDLGGAFLHLLEICNISGFDEDEESGNQMRLL